MENIYLENKIISKLQEETNIPHNITTLGIWFDKNLTEDDMDIMYKLEEEFGEDECNRWLAAVLVKSERYKSDDGVTVERQ